MKSIIIIGYGQLGKELCKHLSRQKYHLTTLSRSIVSSLSDTHHHIQLDLDTIQANIGLPEHTDCLFYFVPPSDKDLSDNRLKQFLSSQNLSIKHLIYMSTSGVYGDCKGQWIDENTTTNPTADRSKRRLDAENQLLNYCENNNIKLTILRCSAIYSEKTLNKQQIKNNTKPVIKAEQAPFTNRIYLQDLVTVCLQAMKKAPVDTTDIYNVSDGRPSTTTEHAWLLSDLAGLKRRREIDISDAKEFYSAAYLSYLSESKKLDITKLKTQLNPEFSFDEIKKSIQYCLQNNND